jgi:hypothetical protein
MSATARVDVLISTLTASDVGTLDSIVEKLQMVHAELTAMDQPELARRAQEAIAAIRGGDVAEFKRARAFLQAKLGHLR